MKIEIEFETTSDAFFMNHEIEITKIMAGVNVAIVQDKEKCGRLRDTNGNTIGKWVVED